MDDLDVRVQSECVVKDEMKDIVDVTKVVLLLLLFLSLLVFPLDVIIEGKPYNVTIKDMYRVLIQGIHVSLHPLFVTGTFSGGIRDFLFQGKK